MFNLLLLFFFIIIKFDEIILLCNANWKYISAFHLSCCILIYVCVWMYRIKSQKWREIKRKKERTEEIERELELKSFRNWIHSEVKVFCFNWFSMFLSFFVCVFVFIFFFFLLFVQNVHFSAQKKYCKRIYTIFRSKT